jgi:SAM-dependent methyltransferase
MRAATGSAHCSNSTARSSSRTSRNTHRIRRILPIRAHGDQHRTTPGNRLHVAMLGTSAWASVQESRQSAVASVAMSAWHELVERDHDLQNPTSPDKVRLVGSYLRLGRDSNVLDVACGKAGPALVLAREFGCRIHGIEISTVFAEAARKRIAEAGLEDLVSVEVADASQLELDPRSYDVALCIGAAFVWGHIGDAAATLAPVAGAGRGIAIGEPFWRQRGRDEQGFVDLPSTVARFEASGVEVTGMVAASENDWDSYESLHWRAAIEIGGDEVLRTHLSRRDDYLTARRADLGWAIFTGRVR